MHKIVYLTYTEILSILISTDRTEIESANSIAYLHENIRSWLQYLLPV